jgi:hypothetical protein
MVCLQSQALEAATPPFLKTLHTPHYDPKLLAITCVFLATLCFSTALYTVSNINENTAEHADVAEELEALGRCYTLRDNIDQSSSTCVITSSTKTRQGRRQSLLPVLSR